MKTLHFHAYGEPLDVLRLETAEVPEPSPGRVRVRVHACGLNPADWALCRGLFAGGLPRGVGLDVSGVVDALGAGVEGVEVGEPVFGDANYADGPTAGASDFAILNHWAKVPAGLGMREAAALPMAVETAARSLDGVGVEPGQIVLIHGAGTMMGYAAVQMALMRGARVVATAGPAFTARLRALGAEVTPYGEGMVERVLDLTGGPVDAVLDTAPPSGAIPDLVRIAGDDARRVYAITDLQGAVAAGARTGFSDPSPMRHDAFEAFGALAAEGRFEVPVGRCFALEDWREAVTASQSGHAQGKLLLLLDA